MLLWPSTSGDYAVMPRVLSFTALVLLGTSVSADDLIRDANLGFSATIPAGFTRLKEKETGDTIFFFHRPRTPGRDDGIFIAFERMRGTIGRDQIKPEVLLARLPAATFSRATWNGFVVSVIRNPMELEGVKKLTYGT